MTTIPAETYRSVRNRAGIIAAGRGLTEHQQLQIRARAQIVLHKSGSIGTAIAAASSLARAYALQNSAAIERGGRHGAHAA